jgi:hypothetical protein
VLTFPKLKTDAVAQYPAKRALRFQNQVMRFVDGSEQRYRDCAGAVHTWEIRLDQLDEGEMAALEEFFEASQGAFGSFAFTDPWDGHVYADCSLDMDTMELDAIEEMRGRTSLTIRENLN